MDRRDRSKRGPIACGSALPALFSKGRGPRRGDGASATWTGRMERNLFKYIWRHSWRDQVYILVIVLLLQVFYFISLDLPKRIVNDGIRGEAFRETTVEIPMHLHYSYGPSIHPENVKPEGKVNTIPFMRISFGPYLA